ncbi:MAG TPA: M20/M25/M40 family metallo-hydrolase [Bryobacteraceae bacterium]|jgi:acetylornithine deacetylase/succinyl-diaminopimelate desuccinylase-like protein|nr:M20/M25/M40 family metallo-hydrolase [Bryobacteraceae bacterium]
MRSLCLAPALLALTLPAFAQQIDWPKVNEEAMTNYQSLVRIDSTASEAGVAAFVKETLEAEGIAVTVVAKDPARPNVIARIKGNGTRKPLLIMGHSDTVKIDPSKWTFPPFSATRNGGYVYGRGTLDDKSNLFAAMMTMVLLKRSGARLDRDVIFVSEAGEESASGIGIGYLVSDHFPEIEAEACLAEGGGVIRRGGVARFATVQTMEKRPSGARLVAKGPSGHGSRPTRSNAIAHLSEAVAKVAFWDPPMRLNDTTRTYFEKLAMVSDPEDAARFRDLLNPAKSAVVREYLAINEPATYSMLHTSISPNIIQGGFQRNVIPSEATATLDIRALPDESMPAFYDMMRKVINDPSVEVVPDTAGSRPPAAPANITSDVYKAIEASFKQVYGVMTLPLMGTGATDMSQLRSRGVQCYGIGAARDDEDVLKGFGAHSDQERMPEDSVAKHLAFFWNSVTAIAGAKF